MLVFPTPSVPVIVIVIAPEPDTVVPCVGDCVSVIATTALQLSLFVTMGL